MSGGWIGREAPYAWPLRSPISTPLNFLLWGYVKNLAYQVENNDVQQQMKHFGYVTTTTFTTRR